MTRCDDADIIIQLFTYIYLFKTRDQKSKYYLADIWAVMDLQLSVFLAMNTKHVY